MLLDQRRPAGASPKAHFLGNWRKVKAKQWKEQRSQEGEAKRVSYQSVPRAEPEPGSKGLAPSHHQGPPTQSPGSLPSGPQSPLCSPVDPGRGGKESRVGRVGVKTLVSDIRKNRVTSERSAGTLRMEGTLPPPSLCHPAPDPHGCSISCHTRRDHSRGRGCSEQPRECPSHGCTGPEAQTGN